MNDLIDNRFFEDLARLDPENVCERAMCRYDQQEKSYYLKCLKSTYKILPHKGYIEILGEPAQKFHEFLKLFIIHYLLTVKNIPKHGTWISEKDVIGGAAFFRGPHALPTYLISDRFERSIEEFKKQCERFGGQPLDMADAAFQFEVTSRISVAVLFWAKDDEFPAEAKLLFDKNIGDHFALDVIFALAVAICQAFG